MAYDEMRSVPHTCLHVWDSLLVPRYIHSQTSWRLFGAPKIRDIGLTWATRPTPVKGRPERSRRILVVPLTATPVKGHDLGRAINGAFKKRALAPEALGVIPRQMALVWGTRDLGSRAYLSNPPDWILVAVVADSELLCSTNAMSSGLSS